MTTYRQTTEILVEAEQYDPETGKVPKGVFSDGRGPIGTSKNQPYIKTSAGAQYLKPGDYLVKTPVGTVLLIGKEAFESNYEEVKES